MNRLFVVSVTPHNSAEIINFIDHVEKGAWVPLFLYFPTYFLLHLLGYACVCGHGCLDACAEARGDLWESVLSFYHQAPGDLTRAASVAPSPAEPSRQLSLCLPFREGFDYLHLNLSFCFGYFAAAAASAAVIVIILF